MTRARSGRGWRVVAAMGLVAGSTGVGATPAGAQQQNEIVVSVEADGTEPFSATDPADDGAGGHTPGEDLNGTNGVVRSYDQIRYRIDWNANEVDATGITVTATLPPGVTWVPEPGDGLGLPPGCDTGSITGNGGRDLVCGIADGNEGTNGTIRPAALVTGLVDDTVLPFTATITTAEAPGVTATPVSTVVSSTPRANWVKGKIDPDGIADNEPDEIYTDVDNGGVLGRVFLWNVRLAFEGPLRGSEGIDPTVPIQLFDHAFDVAPSAVLATGLVPDGRTACGVYDGVGPYPADPSSGTWTCTPVAGGTYPLLQIDITGHDTSLPPTLNASGSVNFSPSDTPTPRAFQTNTLLSGQVAIWAPETELQAKPAPTVVRNAISGTTDPVTDPNTDIDPIQVTGTGGPVDETATGDDFATAQLQPAPPVPAGSQEQTAWVRFQNGPYAQVEVTSNDTGITYRGYDTRIKAQGGTGRVVTDNIYGVDGLDRPATAPAPADRVPEQRWDGQGLVTRNEVLTVVAEMVTRQTIGAPTATDATAQCTQIDNTHMEIVALPATYPITIVSPFPPNPDSRTARAAIGGRTGTPTTPYFDVIDGITTLKFNHNGRHGSAVGTSLGGLDYVLEIAAGVTVPDGDTVRYGTTCNQSDADGRGWVDAVNGDVSVFDSDGDGTLDDVTHLRVRVAGGAPWAVPGGGASFSGDDHGHGITLSFQVRVKDDPAAGAQENGQELFVHTSRAWGDWDPIVENAPTGSATCFAGSYGGIGQPAATTGWCNMEFEDDGTGSTDVADLPNDWDNRTAEEVINGATYRASTDKVSIVGVGIGFEKVNVNGENDVRDNGDIVEFELRPRVTGTTLDSASDVRVIDQLGANFQFVAVSQPPSSPGASCALNGAGQLQCDFGTQTGGWSDLVRYQVRLVGAGPDQALRNDATMTATDTITATPMAPIRDRAYVYTVGAHERGAIVKAVDTLGGPCVVHPTIDPPPADWGANCSLLQVAAGVTPPSGPLGFDLSVTNEGNVPLTNYRIVDVLPFAGDGAEPASGTGVTGDGRTPASAFSGTLAFTSITGASGETFLYTADDPTTVSRDPDVTVTVNTWCDAPAGGAVVFGTGACPATAADVTAVHASLGTLQLDETRTLELRASAAGFECDDIWTNTFGARTDDILLPIRSNDVSVMAPCVDVSVEVDFPPTGPPTSFDIGDEFDIQITVRNDGSQDATNVDIGSLLPPWVTYVSDTSGDTPDQNGNELSWEIGTVTRNGVTTFTVRVRVNSMPTPDLTVEVEVNDQDQPDLDSTPRGTDPPTSDNNPPDEDDEAQLRIPAVLGAIELVKTVVPDGTACPGTDGVTLEVADGAPVIYCYEVTNSGGSALTGITIEDADLGLVGPTALVVGDLAVGASTIVQAPTQPATPLLNTASVSGTPADDTFTPIAGEPPVADTDTAAVETLVPAVDLQKTVSASGICPGVENLFAAGGAAVTYCFEVENTGTAPLDLAGMTFTDADLGIDATALTPTPAGTLAPGATATFSAPATVAGDLLNTASVSLDPLDSGGTPLIGGTPATDDDTAEVTQADPAFVLSKGVYVGHDSGSQCTASIDDAVTVSAGTAVTYCFTISNTSSVAGIAGTLVDQLLDAAFPDGEGGTSNNFTAIGPTPPFLAAGTSVTFFFEDVATADLVNTIEGIGTPTAPDGTPLPGAVPLTFQDTATVDVVGPAVTVEKTISLAADCSGRVDPLTTTVGVAIWYCFEITNTGDTSLTDIRMDDPPLGFAVDVPGVLAPGASILIDHPAVATADLDNVVDVTATPSNDVGAPLLGLPDVSATDGSTLDVITPSVQLVKTIVAGTDGSACPGVPVAVQAAGDDITYCFEITNTGDTALSGFTVEDAPLGVTLTDPRTLAPGESFVLSAPATVTASFDNTASVLTTPVAADGTPLPSGQVSDIDSASVVVGVDALDLRKLVVAGHDGGASCPSAGEVVQVGDDTDITFCFVVTNTGAVPLTGVVVDDPQLGRSGDDAVPVGDLAPGQSVTVFVETTATTEMVNTATARGLDGTAVVASSADTAEVRLGGLAQTGGVLVDLAQIAVVAMVAGLMAAALAVAQRRADLFGLLGLTRR